jgi:hypothetical protein
LPHPKLELLDEKYIWIPDGESYGGYTDRHAIVNRQTIIPYLNILNNFVLKSNEYFTKLKDHDQWNLEKIIKFNLEQQNQIVKEFPYVMYAVRNKDTGTRWAQGNYSEELGYYIKYQSEYDKSSDYKNEFNESGLSIDEFYKNNITVEGFQNKSEFQIILFILFFIFFIIITKNILWVCILSFITSILLYV